MRTIEDVCSLPERDRTSRIAWIRDEILPHVVRRERLATGVAYELDAVPGLAEKLDRLVALERECCGGIEFARTAGSQPDRLRLEIRGIDADAIVIRTAR